MHYHRLIALVLLVNGAPLARHLAVQVVSNKAATRSLERVGVPTFGPIWDS